MARDSFHVNELGRANRTVREVDRRSTRRDIAVSCSRAAGGVRSGRDPALGVAEELSECWEFRWEVQKGCRQCLHILTVELKNPRDLLWCFFPEKAKAAQWRHIRWCYLRL